MKQIPAKGREVQNEHRQALECLETIQGEQVSIFKATELESGRKAWLVSRHLGGQRAQSVSQKGNEAA